MRRVLVFKLIYRTYLNLVKASDDGQHYSLFHSCMLQVHQLSHQTLYI